MATQKEKIIEAKMMALSIKSIADRLEFDAKDYGQQYPLEYAKELRDLAESFLKLK